MLDPWKRAHLKLCIRKGSHFGLMVLYRIRRILTHIGHVHSFSLVLIVLLQRDALCSRDDSASLLQSKTDVKRGQLHSTISTNMTKIAIYTANFGGYDPITDIDDHIADVPDGVRAFYFSDSQTLEKNAGALQKWKEHGWEMIPYELLPGNEVMEPERLTAKELKFTPPDWLLHGSWDWLIHYDSHYYLNAKTLLPFLQQREHMALVLHDYCYFYKECCGEGNGFKCFEHDMDFFAERFSNENSEKQGQDDRVEKDCGDKD